ncbi:MAG: 6-pyruvoyl tetrahydrobiopterin synthase [Campylobacteraceae bacterium 4484_166]|nr:MAG: 6-pyruvoyl tetrahydrobiopterin synthase [Campylobacteraceae bacterium 4484_166]
MRWEISKEFEFCYGHRVWSQTLNKNFALDDCLVCRHLHGHQGKVIVHLKGDKLKDGMITDFKHLNWFKKFLDDRVDHKFILDINDPLYETMLPLYKEKKDLIYFDENYYLPDLTKIKNEPNHIREYVESFVLVDFVPTSENLSYWFISIVQKKMAKLGVEVSKVELYETSKSKSMALS